MRQHIVQEQFAIELLHLIAYWSNRDLIIPDKQLLVAQVANNNKIVQDAHKAVIHASRMLYGYSLLAANGYAHSFNELSTIAFNELTRFFIDPHIPSVYWTTDAAGIPVDKTRHAVAQGQTIYGLCAYAAYHNSDTASELALRIFYTVEFRLLDKDNGFYHTSASEDWDINATNTFDLSVHLHLMEAYTALYEVTQNPLVKSALEKLVTILQTVFYNSDGVFHTSVDSASKPLNNIVAYGHNAEVAWLLLEAARVIKKIPMMVVAQNQVIQVANNLIKNAIQSNGRVVYQVDLESGIRVDDAQTWVQLEVINVLEEASRLTNKPLYGAMGLKVYAFAKAKLKAKNGEWYARTTPNGRPYDDPKIGMWKSIYHNSRAFIKAQKKV